jgi:hypothetical protein
VRMKKTTKRDANRKSPMESATLYEEGTRMKGVDGNFWTIKTASNGVKRWARGSSNSSGSSLQSKKRSRSESPHKTPAKKSKMSGSNAMNEKIFWQLVKR